MRLFSSSSEKKPQTNKTTNSKAPIAFLQDFEMQLI